MLPSMYRTRAAVIAMLTVFALAPLARSADPAPAGTQAAADAPQTGSQPLTPCLAVHADGTPIGAITQFPSTKQITVAFRLKPDETATKLTSRWIAAGGSSDAKPIAENSLELKDRKAGWLRLTLPEPAAPGKYQLVALLDEKPWQTANIEIVPAITDLKVEKVADLVPFKDGNTMNYEMVVVPGKNTKSEIPGIKPDADGSSRGTLTMAYGTADDIGMPVALSINGKVLGEMWVKVDDEGLRAVKMKEGDKQSDVSNIIYPLPPRLEDGVEWTAKSKSGGEQKLRLFGPILVGPAEEPVPGFLVFSEEEITAGDPGVPASRGRETVVRSFIPGVGMYREERVAVLGGQLTGRNTLTLSDAKPYKLVADPAMKGRLGRVRFLFPKDAKADSAVAVYKSGEKGERISGGYGPSDYEMMPGKYEIEISKKRVPVEVKSAHSTIPACGVLRIHASGNTAYKVLDADQKTELAGGYGAADVALPAGTYYVDIAGASEPVKIEDGKIAEF